MTISNHDLNAAFAAAFNDFADRPAIYTPDGQTLDFARVERTTAILTQTLHDAGVRPGHNVICLIENSTLNICFWFAVWRLGANFMASKACANFDAAGIKVDFALIAPGQDAQGAQPVGFHPDALRTDPTPVPSHPAGGIYVPTTHTPRDLRVVFMSAHQVMQDAANYTSLLDRPSGPVFMTTSLESLRGFRDVFRAFLSGQAVMGPDIDAASEWDMIRDRHVTELFLSPLTLHRLLDSEHRPENADWVTRVFIGGGSAQHTLLERAAGFFRCPIELAAGTVETSVYALTPYDPDDHAHGLIGQPRNGIRAEIRDPSGKVLGPDSIGRLALWVPEDMRLAGYLDGPAAYDPDGWVFPGFLASMDADGVVTKHGRTDDRINLGGTRYFSGKIEAVIDKIPTVRQSTVIRVFAPSGAEALGVVVEPNPGFDPAALSAFLKKNILGIGEVMVRQIDRTPTGPTGVPNRQQVARMWEDLA